MNNERPTMTTEHDRDFAINDFANMRARQALDARKDSQPKPASVEEIMGLVVAHESAAIASVESPADLMYSRVAIKSALLKQAEALAQALAEVKTLKGAWPTKVAAIEAIAERDQLRTQLAALQYDGELPEPTVKPFYFCNKCGHMGENGPSHDGCDYLAAQNLHIYTADQVRQAIASDRAKRAKHELTEVRFDSECNVNGVDVKAGTVLKVDAQAKQNKEAYYAGLDGAIPNGWRLVPVETTKEMRMAAGSAYLDTHGYADSWIEAVYKVMLAAAPSPKDVPYTATQVQADKNELAQAGRDALKNGANWFDLPTSTLSALITSPAPSPKEAL